MKILVLNSGSSSLKFQLFDMRSRSVLASGAAERIGEPGSRLVHHGGDGSSSGGDSAPGAIGAPAAIESHGEAVDGISAWLAASNVLGKHGRLDGIGHRVVHGGEAFREPTLINADVVEGIRGLEPLAPLHNPANLLGIEVALAQQPGVPQVAVFDTAFHQTLPPRAFRYAVPDAWYESLRIRRYGFHGSSHAWVTRRAAEHLGRPATELNLIVLHLGNGASATAVAAGCSIDTSMGMTPLEGLVMGTRSGDLDPAVIFHVAREAGLSLDEIDSVLNEESGLAGLCGLGDMRDALAREAEGDARARLAIEVYVYRIRKYIGAYTAALGRVDAIAFTAGVGENSPEIRERVCMGLGTLGIQIDPARNRAASRDTRSIRSSEGGVEILVVPTNEELEIAEQTLRCIEASTATNA